MSSSDRSPWAVFLIFLRLGLTCFGGPVAHLGYFRAEFVERRAWLSERSYADLVALCQFLPGPASSQVGMALGLSRCGYRGALAAWLGFTLPSAVALILFALWLSAGSSLPAGALHGLKVVAVAVVAQAVWGMARTLCPDWPRRLLALLAAACTLLLATAWAQLLVIVAAAVLGLALLHGRQEPAHEPLPITVAPRAGMLWLALLFLLLIGLPLAAHAWPDLTGLAQFDAFYRSGALVFGGGHVVLPLLQAAVVAPGWVDRDAFLAGYGVAQAVPGPLFSFAAFLGAAMRHGPSGWAGGLLCLVAIFLPAFLLVAGALPFWERLRRNARMRGALAGINAAVVGLLLAALYDPVWTSAIFGPRDLLLAALALFALMRLRIAPWQVVLGCALAGWLVG